ncbi:Hypothetical protein PHPALM_37923 [Phytophthora palmivora]|uniref:Uncharacterized protein n=1 Tax=Phytophthora palmivora TaxID=4796 RepID=A0A2P4WW69_9STRA|nr:Hypothetical protein PHPALM_37923 [Phytophthora palmivora]
MGKTLKSHNVVSVGSDNGLWKHQTQSRKKCQRLHTHSVVVAAVKSSQVIPAASTDPNEKECLTLTFREAYGVLGKPMLGILVVCILWTAWLICVALAPNQAANWLMGTEGYDNGQFWLIIDTNPAMIKIGAAGLVFVNMCYVYVVVKIQLTTQGRASGLSNRLMDAYFKFSVQNSVCGIHFVSWKQAKVMGTMD